MYLLNGLAAKEDISIPDAGKNGDPIIYFVEKKSADTAKGNLVKKIKVGDEVVKITPKKKITTLFRVTAVYKDDKTGNWVITGKVSGKVPPPYRDYHMYFEGKKIDGLDSNGQLHQGFNVIDIKDALDGIGLIRPSKKKENKK